MLPPSRARAASARRPRAGKVGPLVPVLALLMVGGTLYGLWELTGGRAGAPDEPVRRRAIDGSLTPAGEDPDLEDLDATAGSARTTPARGSARDVATLPPADAPAVAPEGPLVRRELARVARTFRTATPDLRGLNDLIRALACRCSVLAPSVEREDGTTRGMVNLEGTDLEATFESTDDGHRIAFVESSFDTVHPPFLRLELEISFTTPARKLDDARARLAFVPNPERKALDHIGAGEELRVGWDVRFGEDGAEARGIGARVAADLERWQVGPSEKTRRDKSVRDLSSFQAWRAVLADAP